jgi:hypothetical protein
MMTYSEKLRFIADFFEQHPELPTGQIPDVYWAITKDQALNAAKLPGAKKRYDNDTLWIDVPLRDDLQLRFFTERKVVCTAKRVETVVEPAIPERTYEKVVEWECHPLLQESENE